MCVAHAVLACPFPVCRSVQVATQSYLQCRIDREQFRRRLVELLTSNDDDTLTSGPASRAGSVTELPPPRESARCGEGGLNLARAPGQVDGARAHNSMLFHLTCHYRLLGRFAVI